MINKSLVFNSESFKDIEKRKNSSMNSNHNKS